MWAQTTVEFIQPKTVIRIGTGTAIVKKVTFNADGVLLTIADNTIKQFKYGEKVAVHQE